VLVFQLQPKTIAAVDEQSVQTAQRSRLLVSHREPTAKGIQTISVKRDEKKQVRIVDLLSKLEKVGPMFPATAYSMSDFSVEGVVQGDWPIVIDYELEADSTAEVTISINEGGKKIAIPLTSTNGERKDVESRLPKAFGDKQQLGVISFKAFKNGPEPRVPADFFLYGLGFGYKAVGSMVLVQLKFKPDSIRPKLKEKASYSFKSLSDFNSVTTEFKLATRARDGSTHSQLAYSKEFKDGVRQGQTVAGDWDGKNSKGQISVGPHQFHVRAWRTLKSGADWAFAAERVLIKVEKE
jgi:hypothetical protein